MNQELHQNNEEVLFVIFKIVNFYHHLIDYPTKNEKMICIFKDKIKAEEYVRKQNNYVETELELNSAQDYPIHYMEENPIVYLIREYKVQ